MIESSNKGVRRVLLEGDIVPKTFRSVTKCTNCLWDISASGMVNVPYVVSSTYSDTEKWLIDDALQEFETMTCMKFVNRSTEADYLYLDSLKGCYSYVARTGGKQIVSLDKAGCMTTGIIQHEILHALGFYHEHTRSDRADYVTITEENILPGHLNNFIKQDTNNLDLAYDYSSIMHFHKYTFTNTPGKATIVPKPDPKVPIGQKLGMGSLDVVKINKAYNCNLCRKKLTNHSGTFSADSNNLVKGDNSCLWLIEIPDYKIYLEIELSVASGCHKIARAFDGGNKQEPDLLANSCGGEPIPPLISSGNLMLLELVSLRPPVEGLSFSASYHTGIRPLRHKRDPPAVCVVPTCVVVNIPPLNSGEALPEKISLNFPIFDMERSTSCSHDYVNVTDGSTTDGALLGTYCGTVSKTVTVESLTNVLILHFHSGEQVNNIGFKASWRFG
ncbi:astacin-like metalloendopeptidase [Spea bombifrons]|uniref:astacin-like metalloendopeptidase n=1 Tax=Spea bombifrons TaxID=233779 RepID=UPI00234BB7C2|nr:astacin-like metalloendopeptidase [Spea bombifrons]